MYKKRFRVMRPDSVDSAPCSPFASEVRVSRPMSYFVKGGVDIDGYSNRPGIPGTFSDAKAISAGDVDIATDPTVSRLDITDYASVLAASKFSKDKSSKEEAADDIVNVK